MRYPVRFMGEGCGETPAIGGQCPHWGMVTLRVPILFLWPCIDHIDKFDGIIHHHCEFPEDCADDSHDNVDYAYDKDLANHAKDGVRLLFRVHDIYDAKQ